MHTKYAMKGLAIAHSLSKLLFQSLATLVLAIGVSKASAQTGAQAAVPGQADNFVDHIGVDIHNPSQSQYPLKVYSYTADVQRLLNTLQIRHYRTDFTGTGYAKFDADWAFYQSLYSNGGTNSGPKALVIAESFSMSDLITRVSDQNNVPLIDAIEGPNETDVSHSWTYNPNTMTGAYSTQGGVGIPFPTGTQDAQGDIWGGIQGLTTTFPIVAPSSGSLTLTPPSECSFYSNPLRFNFENMHSYTFPGQPDSSGLAKHMIHADEAVNNCQSTSDSPLPIYATETGYNTAPHATSGAGVSELAQGKYTLRTFAEYWNRPKIARTYIYELLDEGTDYSNAEFAFGLVHADRVTVKPAFTGTANLISILQDPGSSFTTTPLEYALTSAPSTMHRTLLQKRNGDYYLLLWNEVSVWSSSSGDITNNAVPVTLIVPGGISNATTYTFAADGTAPPVEATVNGGNSINLTVPDSMLVVRFTVGVPGNPPITIVDDDADLSGIDHAGTWVSSTGIAGFYGIDYLYTSGGGGANVTFTPTIRVSGIYNVYAHWTANSNRATNAPIDVNYDGGAQTFTEDQTVANPTQIGGYAWTLLGTFPFAAGTAGNVTVRNDNANGNVVADAVMFMNPIIKDDAGSTGITTVGSWGSSTFVPGFYGADYLYANPGSEASVTFTPTIPTTGTYDVYVRWTAYSGRATNAPIDVNYNGGKQTFSEDETVANPTQIGSYTWTLLGNFPFVAGTSGNVTVRNDGASGIVIADAVMFIPH